MRAVRNHNLYSATTTHTRNFHLQLAPITSLVALPLRRTYAMQQCNGKDVVGIQNSKVVQFQYPPID